MSWEIDRPPALRLAQLRSAVVAGSQVWQHLDIVDRTESTNEDLRRRAIASASGGQVLVAEHQVAGRGRLGREWSASDRRSLTFSVLLRPAAAPLSPWGWLPLATALAIHDALSGLDVERVGIKWPNDILISERKVAGVLCERVDTADGVSVVVGIGLNVSMTQSDLPTPSATSLGLEGATADRELVLIRILAALDLRYRTWLHTDGGELRSDYLAGSCTVGRTVSVDQPGRPTYVGTAQDVDVTGQLVVSGPDGLARFAAADVTHVRSQPT
jgi:BirA family biotin operon repressor/biotin-[acetyl-CoA-carboxylase] ligase